MRFPRFFRIAICAAGCTRLFAASPSDVDRIVTEALDLLLGIGERSKTEAEICREAVEGGIERGNYTAEHLQMVNSWLDELTNPRPLPADFPRVISAADPLAHRLRYPPTPEPPIEPVLWLTARRKAVSSTDMRIRSIAYESALLAAEEVWIAARKSEDLAPVITQLARVQNPRGDESVRRSILSRSFSGPTSVRFLFSSVADTPITQGPKPFGSAHQLEIADARLIIGKAKPIALPDPEDDPGAFALARFRWKAAGRNLFTLRPRVAAFYGQCEARFLVAYQDAQAALDHALQRGMPAAECAKRFTRLCAFEVYPEHMEQIRADAVRAATLRGEHLANSLFERSDLNASAQYRPWLQLLAEEAANPAGAAWKAPPSAGGRVGVLYQEWRRKALGSAIPRTWLDDANLRINANDVDAEPGGAEARFVAMLRKLGEVRNSDLSATAIGELLEAWEHLTAKDAALQPQHISALFSQLRGVPGSHLIFALRERAGREALDRLVPDSEIDPHTALGILIRERIEQAIAREEFESAEKIATVGELTESLPSEIAESYRETVQELRDTRTADRSAHLAIIVHTDSPAAAEVALRRLGSKR